ALGPGFEGATMDHPYGIAVSPDGANVYLGYGEPGAELVTFTRNPMTGALTVSQLLTPADLPTPGLSGIRAFEFTADGSYVYAAASWSDTVTVFERNPMTGLLTALQVLQDGVDGDLDGAYDLAMTAAQDFVYVTAPGGLQ